MDVKTLAPYLKQKLRRSVDVVPQTKKDQGGDKKDKAEKGGGGGDEGEKKKKRNKKKGGGGEEEEAMKMVEANNMEFYVGEVGYFPYNGYQLEMVHAPQLFSDENPNACSIM